MPGIEYSGRCGKNSLMEDRESRRPVIFIDQPLLSAPLMRWQRFLASMQELPQEEEDFREWTEWAKAVIEWKIGGEKGPAPERIKPVLGPPSRAP